MQVKIPDRRDFFKKAAGALAAAAIVALGTTTPAQQLFNFPLRLQVPQGQDAYVPWSRWLPVSIVSGANKPVMVSGAEGLDFEAPELGHYLLRLRLFGWLPWRGLPVDVTKPIYVVPGGESMGVLVHMRGLVVTGFSPVESQGRTMDPAVAAGLERGDVITQIDGQAASNIGVLDRRVRLDGAQRRPVHLMVMGARSSRIRDVEPVWNQKTHRWHIGVEVQDRTSGVGTMTFYSPKTYQFTALGHSMTDGLTRRPVGVEAGRATGAEIVGVVPSTDTQPGQKVGVLAGPANISGEVTYNGMFGIVGHLDHRPLWGPVRPVPLAVPDQVRTGPAKIITVLHGQKPEIYDVEILKTAAQYSPNVKGLLFRVTDPSLLRETGGIIQGMSGSPIIQGGRVVGAVTHVLVNRPQLGFGCYAYWMERQASFRNA